MRPLTAARPWDDSAWAGTAHMHKHFMRLSLCTVSWRALCALSVMYGTSAAPL